MEEVEKDIMAALLKILYERNLISENTYRDSLNNLLAFAITPLPLKDIPPKTIAKEASQDGSVQNQRRNAEGKVNF